MRSLAYCVVRLQCDTAQADGCRSGQGALGIHPVQDVAKTVEHCPNCGGEIKIIAAIRGAPVIERILRHLGLQARAPPRVPARGDLQQAA